MLLKGKIKYKIIQIAIWNYILLKFNCCEKKINMSITNKRASDRLLINQGCLVKKIAHLFRSYILLEVCYRLTILVLVLWEISELDYFNKKNVVRIRKKTFYLQSIQLYVKFWKYVFLSNFSKFFQNLKKFKNPNFCSGATRRNFLRILKILKIRVEHHINQSKLNFIDFR
jgi:hypothetical protein